LDNITCNGSVHDPNANNFCAPENVNIDFPPLSQWIRIGVHDYANGGTTFAVHPRLRVFCAGAMAADLGPRGYNMPGSPVTFEVVDGSNDPSANRFWIATDIAVVEDSCSRIRCVVKPVYADATLKTPFFVTATAADANFGPPYPPPP
jgi:hypothetical protein